MEYKKTCPSELVYVLGILILAFGTAFVEKAHLGVSMVVAPAYLLHLIISRIWPVYTFGMSDYVFQAFLLIVLSIALRRQRISYLFSFVTAVFHGFMLDFAIRILHALSGNGWAFRLLWYLGGLVLCSIGVAFLFHTYIAPEVYELFVKEVSAKYGYRIDRVKTVYDLCSCLIGVLLSFAFFGFGRFEGVKLGTIFCALVNGWLIGRISRILEQLFCFTDALPFRKWFDG